MGVSNTTFRIEFFASEACDASGYGEGEDYLGYADVSTDGNGNVSFSAELAVGAAEDSILTATATDPNGNTSEFSACTAIEATSSATGLSYDWFYDYDPLYRLTYACSSDWDPGSETCGGEHEFSYTYDSVGNRLTKVVDSQVITYTGVYPEERRDIANRLTDAGGVAYTWDGNGNLLNDGVNTYTYDHANRLISISGATSASYGYNGLGDRVQQSVDGNTTYYSLDLAAGLTQVLDDGDNTYLYGLVRIGEEQPGGWVFHHGDALGSVRQLTDGNGEVTLVRSYQPYGEVLSSSGSGETSYSYTGEWGDASGLIFLRARYYSPWDGRFLTRDVWEGDYSQPMSFNSWLYVFANPIIFKDSKGLCVNCDLGDRVRVDARPEGNIPIYADHSINSPIIDTLYDSQYVEIVSDVYGRFLTKDSWRQVKVTRKLPLPSREAPSPIVIGWVKNIDLLDNCDGPPGMFGCMPIEFDRVSSTYGFGPNNFAYESCELGKSTCFYKGLRGLHNGLDFSSSMGTPLVWPGTGSGMYVNNYAGDAEPVFAASYEGRLVIFGHYNELYIDNGLEFRPGQTIGTSGPPEDVPEHWKASPHLHLGVRSGRVFYNPLVYFSASLRARIVGIMEPYAEGFWPLSMVSFDNRYSDSKYWFWNECPNYIGIEFFTPPLRPR